MAYLIESSVEEQLTSETELNADPNLLDAAQKIYETYCQLQHRTVKQPTGIAIDPETQRGQLVFRRRPILLPGERFVTFAELGDAA
ncbi:MAG: hypothetical protein AAGG02_04175 [Cyanobacteria bacterium P01_H01_bin.15]